MTVYIVYEGDLCVRIVGIFSSYDLADSMRRNDYAGRTYKIEEIDVATDLLDPNETTP